MENQKKKTEAVKSSGRQMLREPDIQPTDDVIAMALGSANNAYKLFVGKLANYDIQLEWRYYTDGKAWLAKGLNRWTGARGGKNETTVFWLSVWQGFFKVTLYIHEKFRADAANLPLNDNVKQMIAGSKQMGNRLKYFPLVFKLDSDEMFEALFILADFKKSMR